MEKRDKNELNRNIDYDAIIGAYLKTFYPSYELHIFIIFHDILDNMLAKRVPEIIN